MFSHPVLGGTGGNPSMAAVSAAIRSRRNPRTVGSDDRGQAFGVDLALRQGSSTFRRESGRKMGSEAVEVLGGIAEKT